MSLNNREKFIGMEMFVIGAASGIVGTNIIGYDIQGLFACVLIALGIAVYTNFGKMPKEIDG